jgi:hypothetical protein
MQGIAKAPKFLIAVFAVLGFVLLANAQNNAPPAAPIPPQIAAAQKIFVSNAGNDCNSFQLNQVAGEPDRPFNQFYANMKAWARYSLVANPADADLIFELRFTCPRFWPDTGQADDLQFRLAIRDPKSQAVLWTFVEHVEPAIRISTLEKNINTAATAIVTDVKKMAGGVSSSTTTASTAH